MQLLIPESLQPAPVMDVAYLAHLDRQERLADLAVQVSRAHLDCQEIQVSRLSNRANQSHHRHVSHVLRVRLDRQAHLDLPEMPEPQDSQVILVKMLHRSVIHFCKKFRF